MFAIYMLISHTLSDFILQTDNTTKLKSELKLKGYFLHFFQLLIPSSTLLLFIQFNSYKQIITKISFIIIIHIIFDLFKECILILIKKIFTNETKITKISSILLFLIDQFLHIIIILYFTQNIKIEFNSISYLLFNLLKNNNFDILNFKLIFIIIYISFSGAYFIPLILDLIYMRVSNYNAILNNLLKNNLSDEEKPFIDAVKTGRYIGIFERTLIVIFLFKNDLSAIGFIIAIKSLARFKMMDNKIFAEYYLLGTLLSVIYTFIIYNILYKII